MNIQWISLLCLFIVFDVCDSDDTDEAEASTHFVNIVVYMLPLTDWNGGYDDVFKNALAVTANQYCAKNARLCYLEDNWTDGGSFEEDNVAMWLSEKYLSYKKPYLKTRFSLSLPIGVANKLEYFNEDAPTKFVVHGTILEDITVHAVELFVNTSGYHIIGVNDVELSIPPDNMMNLALTLTAFAILGLCLAIGLMLNWKCGGEPERVEPDEDDADEPKALKKPIVEMEAVGFSKPSGLEAASMAKSAQKVNGNNETKA